MDISRACPDDDLIAAGPADLRAGGITSEGFPVAVGPEPLRSAGIAAAPRSSSEAPEHALYEILPEAPT